MRPELSAAFEACNFLESALCDSVGENAWIDCDIMIDPFVDDRNAPHIMVNADRDLSGLLPQDIKVLNYTVSVHFKLLKPAGPAGMN